MAVLNGRHFHWCAALANIKVGKLAVVLAGTHKAGVLQVEVDACELALRGKLKVRGVGVGHIPDVTAHGAALGLLLELENGVGYCNLQNQFALTQWSAYALFEGDGTPSVYSRPH